MAQTRLTAQPSAGSPPADTVNPEPATQADGTPTQNNQSNQTSDIIVTAERRNQSLQRVPIAVSAISGAALQNSGVQLQTALPRVVPNLRITELSTFISPYLRGVGTEFANAGLESSVAVYLDDIYLARPSFRLSSFADLDRVEVLKGPQGTLYGRNATGGLLRIITNDPVDHFEAHASVSYGSYNRVATDGVLNTPLAEGISNRFTVSFDRGDGYVKQVVPGVDDTQSRNFLFLTDKLLLQPSDNLTIKLSGDYSRKRDRDGRGWIAYTNTAPGQRGLLYGGLPSPGFYTSSTDYNGEGPDRLTQFGASVRIDWKLGAVNLASITGYRHVKDIGFADLDTTSAPLLNAATIPAITKSFSQEFQAVSNLSGPFSYVAGLYYYRERSSHRFAVYGSSIDASFGVPDGPNVGSIDGGPSLVSAAAIGVRSIAPYAQATYAISRHFDLTVGARYTSERKDLRSHVVTVEGLGPSILVLDEPFRSTKFKQFTPKATLSYKPSSDVLLYATYSKGFKSGGFNSVALAVADVVKPETLTDYEVGFKYRNDWLRFSTAAFYYDYKNLQVQFIDSLTGASRTQNAASARNYGAELEATTILSPDLQITSTLGYLHARYRKYTGIAYVLNTGPGGGFTPVSSDLSGNEINEAPPWTASVTGQYHHALTGGDKVGLSGTLAYSSRYYYDSANMIRAKDRYLLNGNLFWSSPNDRFRVDVFGDNLLNVKYRLTVSMSDNGGFYIPAPPITGGVKLTVKF